MSSHAFPSSLPVPRYSVKWPSSRIVASSASIETHVKSSWASFLDRKESGFLHFAKYHSLGNDFILVDNRDSLEPKVSPDKAVQLCDPHYGVGADGIIFVMAGTNGADYTMRIFNSDGSELELENLHGRQSFYTMMLVQVRVDMGEPILKAADVPTKVLANKDQSVVKPELDVDGVIWNVTCVSIGNPHCVTFGTKESQDTVVDYLKLAEIGPKFEHHEMFPARTNTCLYWLMAINMIEMLNFLTEFVQVLSDHHLKVRVRVRGAGATLACGAGACALVVAAVLEGRAKRICRVDLYKGPLEIEWREENNHVYSTGPAE